MNTPLVSVICLCHNHQPYVGPAIRSVLHQTYKNIELIVVDDGSTDGSKEEIARELEGTGIQWISLDQNIGNCSAFNRGFHASRGEYLIDLAADDLLLPKRIEEGINDFANADAKFGIHYSDAFLIDPQGSPTTTFYSRTPNGDLMNPAPSGDLYEQLIKKYFICAPTMMIKREVLDSLNGYDESLTYEDFDFWIRSSRHFHYLFSPAPLVKKRELPNSLGKLQFKHLSPHFQTTLTVCQKIYALNESKTEFEALIQRCRYEIKQCLKTFHFSLIPKYRLLIKQAQRRLSSLSSMDK